MNERNRTKRPCGNGSAWSFAGWNFALNRQLGDELFHPTISVEDFQIDVEARKAVCPAGQENMQCGRLEEGQTGKVSYRFEWGSHCHECPLRQQCLGKDQRHRTVAVGEHHTHLQARRLEQRTEEFNEKARLLNAIEGTQSELVRAHGLRRARYRGLSKARLQNYLAGAACNIKRWIR